MKIRALFITNLIYTECLQNIHRLLDIKITKFIKCILQIFKTYKFFPLFLD